MDAGALRRLSSPSRRSTDIFTSRNIIVVPPPDRRQLEGPYAGVAAPPDHVRSTGAPLASPHAILPTFAPQAVAKYEDGTCALCHQLIDGFIDAGQADAAAGYAQQIPVRVVAAMLGVPLEMADEFTSWVRGVLEIGLTDPKVRVENRMKILGFFRAQLDDRKANPRDDDLITDLLNTRVDGELVSEDYVMGVCNLMLVAGIDTTWSAIRFVAVAPRPASRASPPAARAAGDLADGDRGAHCGAYSPVTDGPHRRPRHRVPGLPDARRRPGADVVPGRQPRSTAVRRTPTMSSSTASTTATSRSASGIHRCAGSNLARLELRVALRRGWSGSPSSRIGRPAGGHLGRRPESAALAGAPGPLRVTAT